MRLALTVALLLLSAACNRAVPDQRSEVPVNQPPPKQPTVEDPPIELREPKREGLPEWKEIDRLADEQKLSEAADAAHKRLEAFRATTDQAEWTRALIKVVQLRTGLHGYETALRFLQEEPRPPAAEQRTIVQLFYAQSLVSYLDAYGWEIRQRERVDSSGKLDLKAWTADQIVAEANRAYLTLWERREQLGTRKAAELSEYLQPAEHPAGVRDTLRDAATYLWARLLSNSGYWRPDHASGVFELDFQRLLHGDEAASAKIILDDPAVHPLLKLFALLDDLEAWHAAGGRRDAALEARLERLKHLGAHFTQPEQRAALTAHLEERLRADRRLGWWSMGQGQLAELVQQTGDLVRAHKLAVEGEQGAAGGPLGALGAARCRNLRAQLEAPDFNVQAMLLDGAGKRSIQVNHKNLPRLYFRAYRFELEQHLAQARDYYLLPNGYQIRGLFSQRPAAEWQVELPQTNDFQLHRTFVTPPLTAPGAYAIAVSAQPHFKEENNRVVAVDFIVTELALVTRLDPGGGNEVRVLEGESGRPAAGAEVRLYQYDYNRGHQLADSKKVDKDGFASFPLGKGNEGRGYFAVARRGEHLALQPNSISFYRRQAPRQLQAAMVFTDRSIYRPTQRLFWKVVAFRGLSPSYKVEPSAKLQVSLRDPNGEVVATRSVTTNAFGSAAGEFTIPTGRLLGGWSIETGRDHGSTSVRVEEYKRPTFEVQLKDPPDSLRLNRPAQLSGEARYYFGLPVTSGQVRWRATRVPLYPWWWSWFGGPPAQRQVVGAGAAALKPDGTFELEFTPRAEERDRSPEVSYRYEVEADVTDEGGETRSAARTFRLGYVAVEARVELPGAFVRAGQAGEVTIARIDLDGTPRPGEGRWRVLSLEEPAQTLLPADEPALPGAPDDDGLPGPVKPKTEGDKLRPRWSWAGYSPQRTLNGWKDGPERASGKLTHDAKGVARLALPALPPGAYRLRYETVDPFGATYTTARELIVGGPGLQTRLPLLAQLERTSVSVGGTIRLLVHSGLPAQPLLLEVFRHEKRLERRILESGSPPVLEWPVREEDRGGLSFKVSTLRDYQPLVQTQAVTVPFDDKELKLEFATFRDKLRPGASETFTVTVRSSDGKPVEARAAEVLAYMFDQSLDLFGEHQAPAVAAFYGQRLGVPGDQWSQQVGPTHWVWSAGFAEVPGWSEPQQEHLKFYDAYGIGGMGRRSYRRSAMRMEMAGAPPPGAPPPAPSEAMAEEKGMADAVTGSAQALAAEPQAGDGGRAGAEKPAEVRSNFAESAFFLPQLLTGPDGSVKLEFKVPDSVTGWHVWAHAVTKDLRGGSVSRDTRSVKELMVRPYVPRFLREGDQAELKVVVNNAGERPLEGELTIEAFDPQTSKSVAEELGLQDLRRPFKVEPGKGMNLAFALEAPPRVGSVAFRVIARAGDLSDGELRPVPLLPSRMHLAQSRFATLTGKGPRKLHFADLAKDDDPTLTHEKLVVTVDAQLFYAVLQALPYLQNYPYECTEQTLNRFVSTGIVSSLYGAYPAVAKMARELSRRSTPIQPWDQVDPNRKMQLEETPWLDLSRGGTAAEEGMVNTLDPRQADAERAASLEKLRKAQTAIGGFPWWPGGPPSPYMTLYIMHGLARAAEFQVDFPKELTLRGWQYLAQHFRDELAPQPEKHWSPEFLTFLNYVATAYPDESYTGGVLTLEERKRILDYSFKHWKEHSPYLKAYLALTLKRMGREKDAQLVFDSVMDSAKTTEDEGTFWAPEDRAWLWYNDTIETHAFALTTLSQLRPEDPRRPGLVHWLFLNKKLNQWKSTRATAEVIYALIKYLEQEKELGQRETVTVQLGDQRQTLVYEPDRYAGKSQLIVPGPQVDPKKHATVTVEKGEKGFAFASATWHFATDRLPTEDRGDFFNVSRRYFRRDRRGTEAVLTPIDEKTELKVGDEVEVQLSLRVKHAAEYVHVRDPRAAGLEPENPVSRYTWDLGVGRYEEVRDSGTNFFFDWLPAGEYPLKYRLRVNMAGRFRVGPATAQSMYAPEFNAYSAGHVLTFVQ